MLSYASFMKACAVYDERTLKYYMFSMELPPLLAIGGVKARSIMSTLRSEFGSLAEDGIEIVDLKPFTAPAVLVWIVASIASQPSRDLLRALMSYTPRSAIDLIFELIDTSNGYSRDRPLIPYRKLLAISKIVLKILELHNYPVEARRR